MPIEFTCPSCSTRFRFQEELSGKLAKCGSCGDKVRIPSQNPAPAVAPSRLDDILDDFPTPFEEEESTLAEMVELDSGDESIKKMTTEPRCPACGMKFIGTTIICVHCGYDTKTKSRPKFKKVRRHTRRKRKVGLDPISLVRGTIFSLIGAMIGAGIWFFLCLFIGREFGWISIGVGFLAGAGMSLGHDDPDGTVAGVISGFCALAGIVMAKACIYVLIALALSAFGLLGTEIKRQLLTDHLIEQRVKEKGLDLETADESTIEIASQQSQQQVAGMTEEEIASQLKVLGKDIDVEAELRRSMEGEGAEDLGIPRSFAAMFGLWDALWFLLAFGTAYRIGAGSRVDD